ncbi:MAG: RNA polymerase sigma factor [Bacteroidetes bacterium]|nr:RNA polymerase sigma factor [Bacteroidota bacterium]
MNRTNTDSEHVAKQERFTALVEPLHGRLLRFTRAMTHDRESARDLASDAILAAWRNFDGIRDEQALLAYLFTTASRLAVRERERGRRFSGLDGSGAEQVAGGIAPDQSAEIALLQEALWKLPEPMREAVTLFEVAGVPMEQIAGMQHVSLSAVKMRISRGREQLRSLLGIRQEAEALLHSEKGERL